MVGTNVIILSFHTFTPSYTVAISISVVSKFVISSVSLTAVEECDSGGKNCRDNLVALNEAIERYQHCYNDPDIFGRDDNDISIYCVRYIDIEVYDISVCGDIFINIYRS